LSLSSLISVYPLDEAGNPTPAWSLKVDLRLIAVMLPATPSLALLISGERYDGCTRGAPLVVQRRAPRPVADMPFPDEGHRGSGSSPCAFLIWASTASSS